MAARLAEGLVGGPFSAPVPGCTGPLEAGIGYGPTGLPNRP